MKKIFIMFLIIFSLFLTSCNEDTQPSSNEAEEENDVNERIESLETELKSLEESFEDISKDMELIKEESVASASDSLTMSYTLFHLIESSSSIRVREGYIVDYVNEGNDKYFIIDYADFVEDDSQPNGFRIENETVEKEKVMITENLQSFIGEYAASSNFPTYINLEADDYDLENIKLGFYKFYFVEEELILVTRIYIP